MHEGCFAFPPFAELGMLLSHPRGGVAVQGLLSWLLLPLHLCCLLDLQVEKLCLPTALTLPVSSRSFLMTPEAISVPGVPGWHLGAS